MAAFVMLNCRKLEFMSRGLYGHAILLIVQNFTEMAKNDF